MTGWLLVVGLLAGFAGGYVTAVRNVPRLLARMTEQELALLARRAARARK